MRVEPDAGGDGDAELEVPGALAEPGVVDEPEPDRVRRRPRNEDRVREVVSAHATGTIRRPFGVSAPSRSARSSLGTAGAATRPIIAARRRCGSREVARRTVVRCAHDDLDDRPRRAIDARRLTPRGVRRIRRAGALRDRGPDHRAALVGPACPGPGDGGRGTFRDADGELIDDSEGSRPELAQGDRARPARCWTATSRRRRSRAIGVGAIVSRERRRRGAMGQLWPARCAQLATGKKRAADRGARAARSTPPRGRRLRRHRPARARRRADARHPAAGAEAACSSPRWASRSWFGAGFRPAADRYVGRLVGAIGFSRLAYKGANGRYRPGDEPEWAVAEAQPLRRRLPGAALASPRSPSRSLREPWPA